MVVKSIHPRPQYVSENYSTTVATPTTTGVIGGFIANEPLTITGMSASMSDTGSGAADTQIGVRVNNAATTVSGSPLIMDETGAAGTGRANFSQSLEIGDIVAVEITTAGATSPTGLIVTLNVLKNF